MKLELKEENKMTTCDKVTKQFESHSCLLLSEHTVTLLGLYSSSQQLLDSQPGGQKEKQERKKERKAHTDTVVCLLLQTPPAEAHWLVALAPPSLIGCEIALPSAAQPGRRVGRHHDHNKPAATVADHCHTRHVQAPHMLMHKNYLPTYPASQLPSCTSISVW